MNELNDEERVIKVIREGDLNALKRLVMEDVRLADKPLSDRESGKETFAIYLALQFHHENIVDWLLSLGINLDSQDSDGRTAMMKACFDEDPDIVEFLIVKGANMEVLDKSGSTALMNACWQDSLECAKLLVGNGAKLDLQDTGGGTALMETCGRGGLRCAKLLVENGAKLDLQDNDGLTALMVACAEDDLECVKLLVENGANINIVCDVGGSALMCACEIGNFEMADFLIKNGADLESTWLHDFDLALRKLKKYQDEGIPPAVFVTNKVANGEIQNTRGFAALEIARFFNHWHIVSLIEEAISRQKE